MRELWLRADEEFVRSNYLSMSDSELAEKLGRSTRGIDAKRKRLGCFRYFSEPSTPIKGEVWKTYENNYEVSNKGRIRRDGSKFLKLQVHKTGYVYCSYKGRHPYIHRLVWFTFNGNIPEGLEINHIDHNKLNNSLYNLELVTRKENCIKREIFYANNRKGLAEEQ